MEQRVPGHVADLGRAVHGAARAEDLQPAHGPLRAGRHHLQHLLRLVPRPRLIALWRRRRWSCSSCRPSSSSRRAQKPALVHHRPGGGEAQEAFGSPARLEPLAGPARLRRAWSGSRAGTVRMGSDAHYPEEGPARASRVDGFWIDRDPVTNAALRRASSPPPATSPSPSGRSTRRTSPARRRRTSSPGSLVFRRTPRPGRPAPPEPVVGLDARRVLAAPGGARSLARRPRRPSGRPRRLRGRRGLRRLGRTGAAHRGASGSSPPAAGSTARSTPGATTPSAAAQRLANYWHGDFPWRAGARLRPHQPGRRLPAQRLRAATTWPATSGSGPHDWYARATRRTSTRVLRAPQPAGAARGELRPGAAAVPRPAQGHQGRLVPVRRQLLPALPPGRPATADGRHRHEPHRLPLRGSSPARGLTASFTATSARREARRRERRPLPPGRRAPEPVPARAASPAVAPASSRPTGDGAG